MTTYKITKSVCVLTKDSYHVLCFISTQLWVKSGSPEVRDAGVTTGKKREIKREVSRFLPGYDVID